MRAAALAFLLAATFACVSFERPTPAAVRVDLIRATPPALEWDRSAPPAIHVLLDVTSSMQAASTEEGVTHLRAAQQAAESFLRSLPPDADVTLHVLGTVIGAECTDAVPVRAPPGVEPGERLARIAASMPSRSEGGLAPALEAIAGRILRDAQASVGARVFAISDLDTSCAERSLCDAAESLSSVGADLDLVVIGDAPVPPCLDEIGGDEAPPLLATAPAPGAPASFRVARDETGEGAAPPTMGVVGGGAVEVAPGRIRIRVDLDPPVDVGPVDLAPNASLRIRILEIPSGDSARYEVFVDGADVRGQGGSVR